MPKEYFSQATVEQKRGVRSWQEVAQKHFIPFANPSASKLFQRTSVATENNTLSNTERIGATLVRNFDDEVVLTAKADTLQYFLQQKGRYPLLDYDQEQVLFQRLDSGASIASLWEDTELIDTILEDEEELKWVNVLQDSKTIDEVITLSNIGLVVSIARKFRGRGLPFIDLIQEGVIGLMRSIESFEPGFEYKFSTYATNWIRQNVSRAVYNKGRLIRLPVGVLEQYSRAQKLMAEYYAQYGQALDIERVRSLLLEQANNSSEESNINRAIATIEAGLGRVPASLDQVIRADDKATLGELLPSRDQEAQIEAVVDGNEDGYEHIRFVETIRGRIHEILERREDQVLAMRFGLDGESAQTLEEIGKKLGLTKERIRQIEKSVIGKLASDQLLRLMWESDVANFVYGNSAEKAALKLGLLDETRAPQQDRDIVITAPISAPKRRHSGGDSTKKRETVKAYWEKERATVKLFETKVQDLLDQGLGIPEIANKLKVANVEVTIVMDKLRKNRH